MELATATKPTASVANVAPPEKGTDYVILERVKAEGGDAWRPVDTVTHGGGSEAAIRKSREGKKGAFKAVPIRNWRGGTELDRETREVTVTRPIRD